MGCSYDRKEAALKGVNHQGNNSRGNLAKK